MSSSETYSVSARYYDDFYERKADLTDLPFYLDLAQRVGGPVLELACGTGRVLLRTARLGIPVAGVDNSPAMLALLRQKLSAEPEEVRERIEVFSGDLRSYRSAKRYRLVTIPFRPMQHMYTLADQLAALQTAASALEPGGRIAFDVFYPKFESLFQGVGSEVLEQEWPLAFDPEITVRRYFRKESVDKIQQRFSLTFIFRSYRGGELIQEEFEELNLGYYTYPHLGTLFLLAGLEPVEEYGEFDKSPLNNSSTQMIFVLRRSGDR